MSDFSDIIRASQRQVTDGFGREAASERDETSPTLADMIAGLNADTPENRARQAIVDAALAQIERAFGPRRTA